MSKFICDKLYLQIYWKANWKDIDLLSWYDIVIKWWIYENKSSLADIRQKSSWDWNLNIKNNYEWNDILLNFKLSHLNWLALFVFWLARLHHTGIILFPSDAWSLLPCIFYRGFTLVVTLDVLKNNI